MKSLKARIVRCGGEHVVYLPSDCQFPDEIKEVLVYRRGRSVVLEGVVEGSVPDGWRTALEPEEDRKPRT